MSHPPTDDRRPASRRELLRGLAGAAGLVAVGGMAAGLILRTVRRGDAAGWWSICDGCPELDGCTLPRADAARRRGIGLATPVRRRTDGRKNIGDANCPEARPGASGERKV